MLQEFDSWTHDWNDCQYFKVNGVRFPSCVMIDDDQYDPKTKKTTEYVLSLQGKKDAAWNEVNTLMSDYPTFELFENAYGSTKEEYDVFKKFLEEI